MFLISGMSGEYTNLSASDAAEVLWESISLIERGIMILHYPTFKDTLWSVVSDIYRAGYTLVQTEDVSGVPNRANQQESSLLLGQINTTGNYGWEASDIKNIVSRISSLESKGYVLRKSSAGTASAAPSKAYDQPQTFDDWSKSMADTISKMSGGSTATTTKPSVKSSSSTTDWSSVISKSSAAAASTAQSIAASAAAAKKVKTTKSKQVSGSTSYLPYVIGGVGFVFLLGVIYFAPRHRK